MVKNKVTGELERTMQGTYSRLVEMAADRAIDREGVEAELESLGKENTALTKALDYDRDTIKELKIEIQNLEAIIDISARKGIPRAPDIVLLSDSMPGISGSLGSVQEACGNLATRGVNVDKPCIRPRENPERTHAKGRHRY